MHRLIGFQVIKDTSYNSQDLGVCTPRQDMNIRGIGIAAGESKSTPSNRRCSAKVLNQCAICYAGVRTMLRSLARAWTSNLLSWYLALPRKKGTFDKA